MTIDITMNRSGEFSRPFEVGVYEDPVMVEDDASIPPVARGLVLRFNSLTEMAHKIGQLSMDVKRLEQELVELRRYHSNRVE